jgi:O-acetyl-ADP-ribose deacetylase (regulator of RNase III)
MIEIVTADITTLAVDAIVNAANGALRGGGGVDGAIHRAAGPQLMTELKLFPGCPTGEAVRTRGYKLRARYVIHAVGPVWYGGAQSEAALLARAYESAFARAKEAGDITSIAFPALSTGAYRFPKPDAAAIALRSMLAHNGEYERIIACLYDEQDAALYRETLAIVRRAR